MQKDERLLISSGPVHGASCYLSDTMNRALKLLEGIFDSLSVGVLIIRREQPDDDESFTALYCNDAGAKAVGMVAKDLIGNRMLDMFPNLRETGFIDKYVTTLADGKILDGGEMSYGDDRFERPVFRVQFVPVDANTLAATYTNLTEQKRALALVESQRATLLEMSTPVIELWKDILLLPLIGELDNERALRMTERLLEAIVSHGARVAIFDITGVPAVDTFVAQHLMQSIRAARMLGAEVILTGISPDTAITLVKLGIDISDVRTFRALHRGIAAAFNLLGLSIAGVRS